nr:unnamed protein product [Digitaria exilis]
MKLLQAIASLFFLLHHKHAGHHKHTISYHDCVKFFEADKGSATADKRGLAAIGAKIIGATAKSVSDRIDHLRASEKDKERLDCLNECAKLYKGAAAEIGKVTKGITSGTNRTLGDAATTLGTVLDAPSTCEEGFKKIHKPSPLAPEDAKFYKQVAITLFATGTL